MPLFSRVRGIGILRTSPFGDSRKFAKNNALNGTKFIGNSSACAFLPSREAATEQGGVAKEDMLHLLHK
jgi:hypothetical protein